MNTTGQELTTIDPRARLWFRWLEMWNGDYEAAEEIIAPKLTCHLMAHGSFTRQAGDSSSVNSPAALLHVIKGFRAPFPDCRIATELGPFFTDDLIIARFRFTGTWDGSLPAGATAEPGTKVTMAGVDFLRLEDGQIAEYWLADNLIDVFGDLGAIRGREL